MPAVPEVGVTELPADAVLIDVREDDEWRAGRAPSARHLPMSRLAQRLSEVPDADPLYVICRSGARSAQVVAFLNQQGRRSVNVAGGMQSWAGQGLPMVAEHGGVPDVV
jgi:rhodanese-related sulfurtransferase